ncbi:MAG: xanthine dehydrogenase accessory protein XdhC [Rhizobiales bacterium]|nr:xanthine dehydrogenase accessory protein XdhC [Hyphomicrobiales bacterium]
MSADDLADWLAARLAAGVAAVIVRIAQARGSTPRDADATMLVAAHEVAGTIGGGSLEWSAIERARELLASGDATDRWATPLGPALGQCCGGHVALAFARAGAADIAALRAVAAADRAARPAIRIFGAGHVGRALARAVAALPFDTLLIDTRPEELARSNAAPTRLTDDPAADIAAAPPGAAVVILTHSHTLDFLIARAALERGDCVYVGMIGSATKRARFLSWLVASGADPAMAAPLVLPIGAAARDKRPEVIACLTAAEIAARLLGPAPTRRLRTD